MSGYLLDTNIASHVIRGDRPEISLRLASLPMEEIAISAVTEGELLYGLARRSYPAMLTERVRQFLLRVDVLAWDHDAAQTYADLRAACEAKGITLAPLDMMIAAQAVAANAMLVTNDKAFARIPDPLRMENWDRG
ncbi:type II toxin-antitoxin system VapC family toxin [Ferrovibrio sp.]|uniref:type II toxin-antitoxin system VapC family toxin n=1 Tax=Ferrovibrio sp. TaxID=1917215 RepID=UPI0025C4D78F|nr:type II toxin-antitoxin system VapC family toxin [Ferrovibrio sp.]MBX3455548.1 type II toxin-antitoxin system VapC family toxin [Ferrovibrio sp.]